MDPRLPFLIQGLEVSLFLKGMLSNLKGSLIPNSASFYRGVDRHVNSPGHTDSKWKVGQEAGFLSYISISPGCLLMKFYSRHFLRVITQRNGETDSKNMMH